MKPDADELGIAKQFAERLPGWNATLDPFLDLVVFGVPRNSVGVEQHLRVLPSAGDSIERHWVFCGEVIQGLIDAKRPGDADRFTRGVQGVTAFRAYKAAADDPKNRADAPLNNPSLAGLLRVVSHWRAFDRGLVDERGRTT